MIRDTSSSLKNALTVRYNATQMMPGPDRIQQGLTGLRITLRDNNVRVRAQAAHALEFLGAPNVVDDPRGTFKNRVPYIYILFLPLVLFLLPPPSAAQPQFTDQTEAAGIAFHNTFGDLEKKYILEAHGTGAAFFDHDNDGDLDLYLVNGSTFATYQDKSGPGNILYANRGNGTFFDTTSRAGVGDAGWGAGCAVGDYDNDGFRDLYVTNYGPNILYHNQGDGTFAHTSAGVGGQDYSASAAFFDYDNDGDLDLYVANYVVFNLENMPGQDFQEERCVFLGGIRVYCGPKGMPGAEDRLYRNEGNGAFADVTAPAGIGAANDYYGLGVVPSDYDGDGDLDLFVANDETPNVLFHNNGDGTFEDIALLAGVAYNGDGDEEAGMGVDFGDFDNDGDEDLYVTNFFRETNTLYENEGQGTFTDITALAGLAAPTLSRLGWGTRFFDCDNDGDLDLFVANGHVYPQVDRVPAGSSYQQLNQLFTNQDGGKFLEVSARSGPGLGIKKVSRGTTFGDYDNDGDVDIFVVNLNDVPNLLRNDGGNNHNWLTIQVFGTRVNRDGIGTSIRLVAGGKTQWRTINGASSYLSHNDIRAHFGLARQAQVELVETTWPDGTTQSVGRVPANKLLVIRQEGGHAILEMGANPHPAKPGR